MVGRERAHRRGQAHTRAGLAWPAGPEVGRRPVNCENAFSFLNQILDFLIHFKFKF
jgi:hypothetical protein